MKTILTPKQRTFVDEYLVDLNATQAAVRAGYSSKTARTIGAQNLAKLNIQKALTDAMNDRAARTGITADRVLEELAKIGFADIRKIFTPAGNVVSPTDLPDDIAAAVQAFETLTRQSDQPDSDGEVECLHKIRLLDKIKALELMARHLGMLNYNTAPQRNVIITMNYGNGIVKRIENGIVK
jgi:phage terminase small subunit